MNIMDLKSFLEEMDNDIDDVKMIVTQLIISIREQLPLIDGYIKAGEINSVKLESHSIKGGARNIMAKNLELAAESLEISCKNRDIQGVAAEFIKLKDSFKEFEDYALKNSLIELS